MELAHQPELLGTTVTKKMRAVDGIDLPSACVLVIDSAVHSGASMLAVCERLADMEVNNIISYTLVLKRGSRFVPTFFGVVIGDEDRAYF